MIDDNKMIKSSIDGPIQAPNAANNLRSPVPIPFSFRINWKTDHRLSISVESGLIKFYSYTINSKNAEGDLKISAIPLLVEFAMPLTKKFQIRAGAGSYFQTTELNYLGKVRSNSVGLGGSYSLFSKDNNSFYCELKWMDSAESQQAIMVLQLSYKNTFFRW